MKGSDNKMATASEYKNQFNKDNYYTITLRVPKDKREVLQALAKSERRSVNNLIICAIEQQYNVDLVSKPEDDE